MSFNDSHFFPSSGPSSLPIATEMSQPLTLEVLFERMQSYEHKLINFQVLVDKLQAAESKIASLEAYNAELEAKLRVALAPKKIAVTQKLPSTQKSNNTQNSTVSDLPSTQAAPLGTVDSTWAILTGKNRPAKVPRSVRRVAAALRTFQEPDPNAPTGFGYLYVPRVRQMPRSQIRRHLRILGIDTSRIIDINFPARGKMGLLVHAQYAQTVINTFAEGKIKAITDLDPQDPQYLEDPKYKSCSQEERVAAAIAIHADRCLAALERLRVDKLRAVGRSFVEMGWIHEEDVHDLVAKAQANDSATKKRKSPPMANARASAFASFGGSKDESPLDVSMLDSQDIHLDDAQDATESNSRSLSTSSQ